MWFVGHTRRLVRLIVKNGRKSMTIKTRRPMTRRVICREHFKSGCSSECSVFPESTDWWGHFKGGCRGKGSTRSFGTCIKSSPREVGFFGKVKHAVFLLLETEKELRDANQDYNPDSNTCQQV
jgi:hypothetical protein